MAIYKEVFERNYAIYGSPTITNDYVASNFSDSNYLVNHIGFPSSFSSFDLITKVQVTSYANHAVLFADRDQQRSYTIRYTTRAFSMYNGSSWVDGRTAIPLNTWYWCRVIYDGSSWKGYILKDQGYTLETLPSLGSWSLEWTSSSSWSRGVTFNMGTNTFYGGQYLRGYMDLVNTKYVTDGTEWRAVKTILKDVSGSVEISKGYYSDGSNKIIMPTSTYNFDALTANQTLGGKNKLFSYTDSTDSVGALITSTTPTGSFKITKDIEHPVYLDPTKNYIAGGELIEPFLTSTDTEISSTKALQYSEAQDTTYWVPSEATVSLDSVKAAQSVGPVNDLYLTTTTGTPTASLSFSDNGAIAGVTTKFPLKQKVYLNNEADKILGVQERPDELVISRNVIENYTVTGSPTITNDYVASNFSSTNWLVPTLNIPQPTGTDVLEIFMKVTTPTSWSENKALFYRSDKDRGFYIQDSSDRFAFYDGNSRLNIVATAGQTYWIGYSQDANKACKLAVMLDDGTYSSVDELPRLSDTAWGSPTTWTSSEFTMVGNVFYLGRYNSSGKVWGDGKIYLQDTVVRVVSAEGTPTTLDWRATTVQDGITASGWSVLYSDVTGYTGNTALDYTTPVEIASSSLEIPAGYGSYLVYLYYINGDIKCIQAGDTVLDKAVFTGYGLNLSDGAIQSVSKQGELCAAFTQRGYGRNTRRYLFIPAANLKEGEFTTRAASGFYDMSVQGTLPPANMIASMKNIEYNSNDKTVVMDGNTFDYIGDMMCTLI